ncbi:hypothetical protein [Alkalihalobacterium elongatum]|uniref:hypothetical protein n=1 Tax=Alkalihalobacterium elongatum TaxID=2675466 RepID=UPI001C1F5BC7|nr:hypothetical protein [Alkalihalobacterium elongatum]
MEINDSLVMIQYEVQKSFEFIDATKSKDNSDDSVLHIGLEKVKLELPVALSSKEVVQKPGL